MPKKVINDYVFYKIICLDNSCELCYVGSTADFNKRRIKHKSDCTNEDSKSYHQKIYKTMRDNGGWSNFKMIEIGKREQLTKRQALQVEEEFRQELKANMNDRKCYLTKEQQQKYHKEYHSKYYKANKEYLNKYHSEYYKANKDEFLEKTNHYYKANIEQIKQHRSEKVKCECGCEITRGNILRHQTSKKHLNFICSYV